MSIYSSIVKTVFVSIALMASIATPTVAADFDGSFKECLKRTPSPTPADFAACRREEQQSRLQIFSTSAPSLATNKHSYTLSLGLGDPVFTGLKRKRDDFVDKYINKPIAEIEEVRDQNIRNFNLKTIYGDTGEKVNSSILSTLESVFGLDSLESTFANFITERRAKCNAQFTEKRSSCDSITDVYQRSQCLAEAQDIKNNCFKYTTKSSKLNTVKNKLAEWENKILDEIAKVSLVDQDEVQKVYQMSKKKLRQVDNKINTLNENLSLNFGGKLSEYLSSQDPIAIIERKVGSSLGVDKSLVGPGAFTRTNTKDILNMTVRSSSDLSNLCDVTTCMVYPESKKYTDSTKTAYSAEYKSKCASKGLTEEDLNKKINEIRRQLTVIVGKLVLQQVMIELPIAEYMNQIKRSVMCASHATMSAISSGIASSLNPTCTSCNSTESELSSGVAAVSKSEAKSARCLEDAFAQASSDQTVNVQVGMGKVSGWLTGAVQSIGIATIAENIPFATPSFQGKGSVENLGIQGSKEAALIEACQKEGESETWVANYNKCVADDVNFNFGFEFNFMMPELFEALRKSTKLQCESSLSAIPTTTQFTFNRLYNNPYVTTPSYSKDHARWVELSSSMSSAEQALKRMKINPALYFETEEAACANKALDIIVSQSLKANNLECSILDVADAPVVDWSQADLDNFGIEDSSGALPTTLVPSAKKLCQDSADLVSDHFVGKSPFTPLDLKAIKEDPNSIYNINNSNTKTNRQGYDNYRITRAIANVNFCSNFFTNVGYKSISQNQQVDEYQNKDSYLNRLELKQGSIGYEEYTDNKVENKKYQETLAMLNRRSQKERYNLCVKNSTYRDVDYRDRVGIKKAVFDFCKAYKIKRFDKYYNDALGDFDFPIVESNTEAVKRIETLKKIRNQEYKGDE